MTATLNKLPIYPRLIYLIMLYTFTEGANEYKTSFTFREYPFKETSKNEIIFHEFEHACEQNPSCAQLVGVKHVSCARECVSPTCYKEIYRPDELEEGEIDVRLNSFKGCFIQQLSRR
nr:PREDICTED: uncharacterized protein LOC109037237 isoform X1 [Bemisia tabaci]